MTLPQADRPAIDYLSPEEIEAWEPYTQPPEAERRHARLRQRLTEVGQWGPNQIAGRRWPIGCVSLEITQRCNLDCTLCYLSEHSEAVQDVPLEEVFRRIELIHRHYGEDTDVQVSGGDPTLRRRAELVSIVRRITEMGMRASLFTNGIRATRDLLEELCAVGLSDVAFHVDMTQQRKGYASEEELNAVRQNYIDRCRGLPLAVFFNTTIYAGNFAEIPELVRFFRRHTDVVSMVSFQLQADTGRGVLRDRAAFIHQGSVIEKIHEGAGIPLSFDSLAAGHPRCNRYAMAFAINGKLYDFYDDPSFAVAMLQATEGVGFPRNNRRAVVRAALAALAKTPSLWWRATRWLGKTLWSARRDLWAVRGRVNKLSFVIHNFMDASRLERDRVQACVFMVATAEGPMSMCLHNAKRDRYILPDGVAAFVYPLKYLKGLARQQTLKHARAKPQES
ncbi:MAG: radical SAM protein [Acidobacteria bacterium]|nr:radical SAM protein [Acidobacteriota bacterium]